MAKRSAGKSQDTHTNAAPNNKEKITMASTELNDELIQNLLSSSKQRGQYDAELKAILDSGAKGVQIDLENGTFAGKKAQSVKTGFENAKKKLADDVKDTVRVIMQEDNVFVINTQA